MRSGLSQAAAARTLKIDRRKIRRRSRANGFPERKPVHRTSTVDEHREDIEQRWQ
jgi:hypothetical protein